MEFEIIEDKIVCRSYTNESYELPFVKEYILPTGLYPYFIQEKYLDGTLNVICQAEGYDRYGRDMQIPLNPTTGQWGTPGIWY